LNKSSFYQSVNPNSVKRKNKARLDRNLRFLHRQKGRNFEKTPFSLAVFFLERTFVSD